MLERVFAYRMRWIDKSKAMANPEAIYCDPARRALKRDCLSGG